MEPVEYLRGIRRRWRVIVAALLVGVTTAWLMSAGNSSSGNTRRGVRYQASVLVLDARGNQFRPDSRSAEGVTLDTIAALVSLEGVARHAAKILKSATDPETLAANVSASADTRTGILTITATASSGGRAERLADAFARGLRIYMDDQKEHGLRVQIRALQRQIAALPTARTRGGESSLRLNLQSQVSDLQSELAAPVGLPILERETAERVEGSSLTAPSSRTGMILIGALAGIFGGLGLALVLERFDRRITTWRVAEGRFEAPLLAEIPRLRRAKGLAVVDQPTSPGADSFRLLASTVLHTLREQEAAAVEGNGHGDHRGAPTLAITSAVRSEGKSLVVANLAAAFGELGLSTIVISCDLRSPTVHRYFGAAATPGITDALVSWDGRLGFRRIVQLTRAPNVKVIPGGSPSGRPAKILADDDLRSLLRYAKEEAQMVILDTPGILLSGDAVQQVQGADAVLLVARIGKTTLEAAERVGETLDRLGAPVIGYALDGSRSIRSAWRRTPYPVIKEPKFSGATSPLVSTRGNGKA